jgi:hypothetical protein
VSDPQCAIGERSVGISSNRAVTNLAEHDASRRTGDRYAAIVEALLAVRPDDPTARFDAEIADAVATNRLDAETARALRWWQRASVRAAEAYAATVTRGVFTLTDDARKAAATELEESTSSWQRSAEVRANLAGETSQPSQAGQPPAPAVDVRLQAPIVELAAVRLLAKDPDAVKSALVGVASTDAPATPERPDLTATTVTSVAGLTSTPPEGKDRSHAHPASTA